MDCRNVKTPAPEVGWGMLDKMLQLQSELALKYAEIEGIPVSFPVNLNVKRNQTILKDFSSRVIEEIAEGYESYELMLDILENPNPNLDFDERREMMFNHLQNANEEQADAMGFFLELLLYIGIRSNDISKHPLVNDYLESHSLNPEEFPSDMAMYAKVGEYILKNEYPLVENLLLVSNWYDLCRKTEITPGFNKLTKPHLLAQSHMAWEVTYHLNIARNYLKNKPWKRTQQLSDESLYKEEIIEAFIVYCGMLKVNDIDHEDIYNLYWKKNQVNHFRIKSHY